LARRQVRRLLIAVAVEELDAGYVFEVDGFDLVGAAIGSKRIDDAPRAVRRRSSSAPRQP
jgi:hypothetical protein